MQGSDRQVRVVVCGLLTAGAMASANSPSAFGQGRRVPQYYAAPPVVQSPPVVQTPQQLRIVFGNRQHLERLADDLVRQANHICLRMDQDFKGHRNYRETYREMYGVLQDARSIRELVKNGEHRGARRNDDRIAAALHRMDRQFHDIEDELRTWRGTAGRHDHHGHQHRSREVARLDRVLDEFETTMHHLMEDYGERTRRNVPAGRGQAPAPAPRPGAAPPPRSR